eukprot:6357775-Amphidinium_carterae.1
MPPQQMRDRPHLQQVKEPICGQCSPDDQTLLCTVYSGKPSTARGKSRGTENWPVRSKLCVPKTVSE